jgi:hypothetical protein
MMIYDMNEYSCHKIDSLVRTTQLKLKMFPLLNGFAAVNEIKNAIHKIPNNICAV